MQREKTKARRMPGFAVFNFGWLTSSLLRQLGDLMRKSRNLSARGILVNDVALRSSHQLRLGTGHCLERRIAVATLDRLFDRPHGSAHLGPARFVDNGAAGNLARRLLGGSRVGHVLKCPSAV